MREKWAGTTWKLGGFLAIEAFSVVVWISVIVGDVELVDEVSTAVLHPVA